MFRSSTSCLEHFEHPIPRIDKILRILMKYKFFSEADMDSGYHQFRISKNLQDIFTFTCSKGKVSMGVLPFGVYWAAGIFQHSMCDIFLELLTICLQIYIDNLNIFSLTRRLHLEHLRQVFSVCKDANIHLRKEKCVFMVTEVQTLGSIVSFNSLKPDPKKIDMLQKAIPPRDRTELRAFLALLQQFCSMLVHLSHVCHKLYELTSTKVEYVWTDEHQRAFLAAKDMLSKEILNTNFDPDKHSDVLVDTSKFATCAILLQDNKMVACTSRTLNKHQRNWATIKREELVWCCKCLQEVQNLPIGSSFYFKD